MAVCNNSYVSVVKMFYYPINRFEESKETTFETEIAKIFRRTEKIEFNERFRIIFT